MKAAEDRPGSDPAEALDRTMVRRVIGKGQMSPGVIGVGGVGREDPTQMSATSGSVVQSDRAAAVGEHAVLCQSVLR